MVLTLMNMGQSISLPLDAVNISALADHFGVAKSSFHADVKKYGLYLAVLRAQSHKR
ncbi:hypothetical protein [Sodalis sp. RH19]|uniref:hypothetical protein n=1 Tax=Sodalis sp. RH19 TaxID=3394334 RepID=UPI0039B60A2F